MVNSYINNLSRRYLLGNSTEHTFRGDLQQLIETLAPGIQATNEPRRQSCGAPDFILTRKDIPIGFIEAKDLGNPDLDGTRKSGNKEQFDRYKASLENLMFTDYLSFHLYRESKLVTKVAIGELGNKGIKPLPENFPLFNSLIKDFTLHVGQTIKSPRKLAVMMAGKARLLSEIIERAVTSDENSSQDSSLKDQMRAFKKVLIHDITPKEFADVYAQTLAYGMFAARFVDPSISNFSRHEAAELIPKTNPFLRKLFGYIAGPDIDDRIKWIVDSLADIFLACDVKQIMKNFGKSTQTEDPVVHFYETFLSEYDPKLRKARGVWYTPKPVVNFIVRAVDDILKTEFNLPQGLADTSKVKVPVKNHDLFDPENTNQSKEREVHKVQILDPATGTGTFLTEVVKNIHQKFEGQQGMWSRYVERDLLPRINGFELLMASYAMAHLKMGMLLTETGYKPIDPQRLNIFLTNSLEEPTHDASTLFSSWLSEEAKQANKIKRETPVMCVIGNPPYSGESANKGNWIMDLMNDYKKEPGGKEKLKEKNSKWINDDYVKFLRFGQHFIEKNGSGILAFINPHGFLDNPTFRGMRWNLLKTYDKIYTIDLHGNSKKKEKAPNGSRDENVFDIMQGVAINVFIKTGQKPTNQLGHVYHYSLYGMREGKYDFLNKNNLKNIPFRILENNGPNYFMVQKDFELQEEFQKGFSPNEIFNIDSVGIATARDNFTIHDSAEKLKKTIIEFLEVDDETARNKFELGKDVKDWKIGFARRDLITSNVDFKNITSVLYRPFEIKKTYYTGNANGFHCRPRGKVMLNFFNKENVGLVIGRAGIAVGDIPWNLAFISKYITDFNIYRRGGGNTYPLYIYDGSNPRHNFNELIVSKLAKTLNHTFLPDEHKGTDLEEKMENSFTPLDLLDYIYAVLHSPSYRKKYREFLKIDFPRIPYPGKSDIFWQLVALGKKLRQLHLLESPKVENLITHYPVDGDNIIRRKMSKNSPGYEAISETHGRVWINEIQYFDKMPLIAWEFFIGGYQPAQKWLKDRRGKELSFEDILHYQSMIVALSETSRLMNEIDKVPFLKGTHVQAISIQPTDHKVRQSNVMSDKKITDRDPYKERKMKKREVKITGHKSTLR